MPTALVTGGAGFLGSHLCDTLLSRGDRVVSVDNLLTGSAANVRDDNPAFRQVWSDVGQPFFIDEDVDVVYHLASPASPADYLSFPLATLSVGARGTHNAIGIAKRHRARFLLASTSEVYGDPLQHPQAETYWGHVNPVGPRGVYDEAKRYAEALTMAYHRQQGVDTAIVRLFNVYGKRMRPTDGRVIPTFFRQACAGLPLTVTGNGNQSRSFCHVSDAVCGVVATAESSAHMPINIGNPEEITLRDLAARICELTRSTSTITFVPLPEDDPHRRVPDVRRALEVLGWTPKVGLEAGLRELAAEALRSRDCDHSAGTLHSGHRR